MRVKRTQPVTLHYIRLSLPVVLILCESSSHTAEQTSTNETWPAWPPYTSLPSTTPLVYTYAFNHRVWGEQLKAIAAVHDLSNYRPIYNRSVICKIIERIVKCRITDHLILNQLFNPAQSAYRKFHFTGTVLFHFTIILSILLGVSKLPVFVYKIFPLLLTPLIAYLYGLEFTLLHLTGSSPIFLIVYFASHVHMISLNLTKVALVHRKTQYLDPFPHSIPLPSVYVFPHCQSITTCALMTPSCSFFSSLVALLKTSLIYKLLSKEVFKRVDNRNVIDFVKETHFYNQL